MVLRHEVEHDNQVVPESRKVFSQQVQDIEGGAVPPWNLAIKNQQEGMHDPLVLYRFDHLLRVLVVLSLSIVVTLGISDHNSFSTEVPALDCLGFGRARFGQGG